MFKVDDYIVYGENGVCKVLEIGMPTINLANKKRQYYKLKPIYENESIIYTPVDNDKIIMRKIISKEETEALINNNTSIEVLYFEDDKMREEKYKEVMYTYDCKEFIKIIKTSCLRNKERLAEGKKNTAIDDKYLKMAEEYLYGEFAISLNMEKRQVKDFIIQAVKNMHN